MKDDRPLTEWSDAELIEEVARGESEQWEWQQELLRTLQAILVELRRIKA